MSTSPGHALETADARSVFIARTYGHLLGAMVAFVALEAFLFQSGAMEAIARAVSGVSWLLVLGAFILVAWGAAHLAHSLEGPAMQYGGLALYVLAEGLIFCPLVWWSEQASPGISQVAAVVTLVGFSALSAIVFATRRDFQFLGPFLWWGGLVALGLIVCAVLFGWSLGPLFSVAMIGFAGASILYDTSKVLHRYRGDQYVGAALELFGSFALMLWYVYRLLLAVALWLAAPESRAPDLLRVFAALTFVAGVATPFVGVERAQRLYAWWAKRSPATVRAWAVLALALGLGLVWALT